MGKNVMSNSKQQGVVRLATAVYRALLVVYPVEFWRAYGPQMVQVFRDRCRDVRRQRGTRALLALWLGALVDLIVTALAERRSTMRNTISANQPLRWAGALVLIGGVGATFSPFTPMSTSSIGSRVALLVVFFIIPVLPLLFTLILARKRSYRAAWHSALYAGLQWSVWTFVLGFIGLTILLEQPSADNPPGPRVGDWWLLGTVVLEGVAIWFVFRAMRRLRDAKLHGAGGRR